MESKQIASKQHRFTMPDEKGCRRYWWVLDYKRLDPELRNTFQPIRERELADVGITLGDDGELPTPPSPSATAFD